MCAGCLPTIPVPLKEALGRRTFERLDTSFSKHEGRQDGFLQAWDWTGRSPVEGQWFVVSSLFCCWSTGGGGERERERVGEGREGRETKGEEKETERV